MKCNPDDVLEESTLFLKNLFHGDFNPIQCDVPAPSSDHVYNAVHPEFLPPPIPGVPPSTSDHAYGTRQPPTLSSSASSKSSVTDPTGFLD